MATKKIQAPKHLTSVERDPYLQPYEGALQARADYAKNKEAERLSVFRPSHDLRRVGAS